MLTKNTSWGRSVSLNHTVGWNIFPERAVKRYPNSSISIESIITYKIENFRASQHAIKLTKHGKIQYQNIPRSITACYHGVQEKEVCGTVNLYNGYAKLQWVCSFPPFTIGNMWKQGIVKLPLLLKIKLETSNLRLET